MSDWQEFLLTEVRDQLACGEMSVQDGVQASLDRIQATEAQIQSLLHVNAEQALAQARELDEKGPDADKPL